MGEITRQREGRKSPRRLDKRPGGFSGYETVGSLTHFRTLTLSPTLSRTRDVRKSAFCLQPGPVARLNALGQS